MFQARLTKRMVRIIQSDPVRKRGERIVGPEALPMLEGFNFNRNKLLADTLYARPVPVPGSCSGFI